MKNPIVSIICISFNHAKYLKIAINSILNLNYPNIQLIIADDASSDDSQKIIKNLLRSNKEAIFVLNSVNIGHCKTFNKAFKLAKGEFIVDFSADDILEPDCINIGINKFKEVGDDYSVFFSDAQHIDSKGKLLNIHITSSFFHLGKVPQGYIYKNLLGKYFISPPTMIIRKSLLNKMKGYDEDLSYEDFDFWVRSSRITKYCYTPKVTIKKRIHSESTSLSQYIPNSKILSSTLKVCKKAYILNNTKSEDFALLKRLMYEIKMSITSFNFLIAFQMLTLSLKVLFTFKINLFSSASK